MVSSRTTLALRTHFAVNYPREFSIDSSTKADCMIGSRKALAVCFVVLVLCALVMLPQVISDQFALTSRYTFSFLGAGVGAAVAAYVLLKGR